MRTIKITLIALLITLIVGGFIFLMIEYPPVYPDIYYEYQENPHIPLRPGPIEIVPVENIPHIVGVGQVSLLFRWV